MNLTKTLSLVLVALASGCISSEPTTATPEALRPATVESTPIEAANCQAMLQLFGVPPTTLSAHLPSGYHTTDLSNLMGLDVASGQAGFATLAFRCQEPALMQGGGWIIFVEPPRLSEDLGLNAAASHAYVLQWLGQNDTLGMMLDTYAVPRTSTFFSWDIAAGSSVDDNLRNIQRSNVQTVDSLGQIFTATNYGAVSQEIEYSTFTLWTESANGTFALQFDITIDDNVVGLFSTGLPTCTMRDDTPMAYVLGRTSCLPDAMNPVDDVANLPLAFTILDYAWSNASANFAAGQFEA